MGADADGLVTDLLDAFIEIRREVSTLPVEARAEGESVRASPLYDLIHTSPVLDLRTRLLERARVAEGESLAAWIATLI
jgi:hypothetical protein